MPVLGWMLSFHPGCSRNASLGVKQLGMGVWDVSGIPLQLFYFSRALKGAPNHFQATPELGKFQKQE